MREVCAESEERRRARYEEERQAWHGSRLLPLAFDFMCSACQRDFCALDARAFDGMAAHEQDEWLRRMQLRVVPSEGSSKAARLVAEHRRVRLRQEALDVVREYEGHRPCRGSTGEFARFMRLLDEDTFSAVEAEADVLPAQRDALAPEVFCAGFSASDVETQPRCLGVLRQRDTGLWWSPSVGLCDFPTAWDMYSGRPGFCPAT